MNANNSSRRKIRRAKDDGRRTQYAIRNTRYAIRHTTYDIERNEIPMHIGIRHTKLVFALCSMVISLILAGCASQQQTEASDDGGTKQVCLGDVDMAHAMQAAQEALIEMHFTIEKADAETGLIRTKPLSGAQFFEFWRNDSVGSFNKTEANLHSIRRTAELQISRNNDDTCIACQVTTQRLNLPEMEATSSAWAFAMFSQSGPTSQTMRLNPEQKEGITWIDLGKDGSLAAKVLEQIQGQFSALGGKD